MTKRCDNCKHWVDTFFKGQSASGYGVWYGDCHHPQSSPVRDERHHNLYIACEKFEEGARAAAAADTVDKLANKGVLTAETAAQIRREILGIAS